MYSINSTENNKNFCLNLHCNGTSSYLFFNVGELYKFKAKDSETVALYIMFRKHFKRKLLGNWTVGNMKKTRSNGYVYEFSVHYDAIAVDYIVGIHKD